MINWTKIFCFIGWHEMDLDTHQFTTPSHEPDMWGCVSYGKCKHCGKDCEN